MIRFENTVTPSPEQWLFVARSTRHPFESYDRADSRIRMSYEWIDNIHDTVKVEGNIEMGENDMALMARLANAGTDHGKFMRMLPVQTDLTAPLYFWKQLDTYAVGTVKNSTSTMHTISRKEFSLEDFSCEGIDSETVPIFLDVIRELNRCRKEFNATKERTYWDSMIKLLPDSYNQKRAWMGNYAVLRNIYHARKGHRLPEWHSFCKWVEGLPYAKELIVGEADE